jgi:hypothetical protein
LISYKSAHHRVLKPGGWIEVQDHRARGASDDESYNKDCPYYQWYVLVKHINDSVFGRIFILYRVESCVEGLDIARRPLDVAHLMEDQIRKAGFESIQIIRKKLPLSPWAKDKHLKEIGMYMLLNMIGFSFLPIHLLLVATNEFAMEQM